MKRSRLLLISLILITLSLLLAIPIVYGAQNLSVATISEMAEFYMNGGATWDALSDGDICIVFKAGSDRELIFYIFDVDSGQTEDGDMYVTPDYTSSGRSYTGTGRWVKMSLSINALSAESIQDDLISKADFADEDWGDMSVSSNTVTLDADVVAPAEMADADHGDFTYSNGVATLDADVVGTAEMADGDYGDFSFSGGSASLDNDVIDPNHMADADHGDFSYSSGVATLDADVVGTAEMADEDHGDFTYSSGSASLDNDVVSPDEIANGDYGDFTFTDGTASLDADVVAPAEMANADHGDFTYLNGVATLDNNVVDSAEIATNAVKDDEIDYSAVTLDDFDYQTAHRMFYADANGDVQELTYGSDGQSLTANGTSTAPGWEYLPRENLLSNTGWVFNSNSDTNKGLATMTFDAGAAGGGDVPDPGDSGTGGTSGATCKIISLTVSTGAFATNDATGTITIGASAGRFHDNETVTFTDGETVVVNHPNSAAGVDLVQNGEFSVDTDPPPGWTAVNGTLTTEGAGKIGNCMMVTESSGSNPYAHQIISVTAGKNYYFTCYIKAGTEATYNILLTDVTNGDATIFALGDTEETAGDWSTSCTQYIVAPVGCAQIRIRLQQKCSAAAGTTMYFDEVSLYEVTACNTGADALTCDGWYKRTTLDVYRDQDETKSGSYYSLKFVPSTTSDYFYYPNGFSDKAEWYQKFAGRTVTFGLWAKTSTASHFRLIIVDPSETYSSFHTGGGDCEWLEVTKTISASPTRFRAQTNFSSSSLGIVYVSQPILIFGSSIGQGNYVPEADRRVYFEQKILSQKFNNTSGWSDLSTTTLNIEADSQACIGKGCKAYFIYLDVNDSGSAASLSSGYFHLQTSTSLGIGLIANVCGVANDAHIRTSGFVSTNNDGNIIYTLDATGSSTFDITAFRYIGGEWR